MRENCLLTSLPIFPPSQAVNTFVGQVAPTCMNQLTDTITLDEKGYSVNAQNQQVKGLNIVYGLSFSMTPYVLLGVAGPGNVTYVQDPSFGGWIRPRG